MVLRRISIAMSSSALVATLSAGLVFTLGSFLIPYWFRHQLYDLMKSHGIPDTAVWTLEWAALSNLFLAVVAASFVLVSLTLLAHRLFWPILERPVYSLQRLGVAKRSKLLGSVGSLLVIYSVGGVSWLGKLIEKLVPF